MWKLLERRIESPSYLIKLDGDEVLWKNSTIAVRSSRDRGIFGMDWRRCLRRMILNGRGHDWGSKSSRSWHLLEQKLSETHGESLSYDVAPRNHSHDPCKPPPRPLQWPRLSGQFFSLKPMYSPSLFFNFWSTREEIKRVSRKISSSSCSSCV